MIQLHKIPFSPIKFFLIFFFIKYKKLKIELSHHIYMSFRSFVIFAFMKNIIDLLLINLNK